MQTAPHSALPPCAQLQGGAGWQAVECISDLHLQASEMGTFRAWERYMQQCTADALFILGDLFEVWVGDDVLDSAPPALASSEPREAAFIARCADVLYATAQRMPVYYMAGNRDFLLGADFLTRTQMQRLQDPTLLSLHGQRYLLTHGDALCLDDAAYQSFRAQVRSPAWQAAFLAKPLAERQQIGRDLRLQSQAAQAQRAQSGQGYSDVDEAAVAQWLSEASATHMVHGHTHRPANHKVLGASPGAQRMVLSDWDADANPRRLEVLRVAASGIMRLAL